MNDTTQPHTQQPGDHRLVFVTGPSGSGRATAVRALEDIGFEAIDNMPLSLLPRLFEGPPLGRPLALGIDIRNRDFSVHRLIDSFEWLMRTSRMDVDLLYLDCSAEVLLRRFSETRRPHPMATAETPQKGIEREFDLLAPIKVRATYLIDTSDLSPHDLRAELERYFGDPTEGRLSVSVQSFSYKRGVPRGVDMIFDVRFLRNPYWEPNLRDFDGRSDAVAEYVRGDSRFDEFFARLQGLFDLLLPAFRDEGKSHLSIAFGCTGGQHRSVAVAEMLANALEAGNWQVSKRHREIERRASKEDGPSGQNGDQT